MKQRGSGGDRPLSRRQGTGEGAVRSEPAPVKPKFDKASANDQALDSIIATHPDADVQREAVETLGDFPPELARARLQQIAERHPNPDVRREAYETLGDLATR